MAEYAVATHAVEPGDFVELNVDEQSGWVTVRPARVGKGARPTLAALLELVERAQRE